MRLGRAAGAIVSSLYGNVAVRPDAEHRPHDLSRQEEADQEQSN
jgi:hypothetical protein